MELALLAFIAAFFALTFNWVFVVGLRTAGFSRVEFKSTIEVCSQFVEGSAPYAARVLGSGVPEAFLAVKSTVSAGKSVGIVELI